MPLRGGLGVRVSLAVLLAIVCPGGYATDAEDVALDLGGGIRLQLEFAPFDAAQHRVERCRVPIGRAFA
jgi:hypothetical protein